MKHIIFSFVLAGLLSCNEVPPDRFTVMTYNVHNLFDTVIDGTEYEDIQTPDKTEFADRCNLLSSVILSSERKPDIIALQEIESLRSLDGLMTALGPFYPHAILCGGEGAIRSALISRWPLEQIRNHATVTGETVSRSILEASADTPFGELKIFVVHLKSASEGADLTEGQRWREIHTLLMACENSSEPYIVAGDFNADPQVAAPSTATLSYGTSVREWEEKSGCSNVWSFLPDLEGTYFYGGQYLKLDRIYYRFPAEFAGLDEIGTQTGSTGTSDHKALWASWLLEK